MQREDIIQILKDKGCRITKQRLVLLDVILQEECSSCKEIYYKAHKIDENIGSATVYRMINTLEEIGAIRRENMYKIACDESCDGTGSCTITLDDKSVLELSPKNWCRVIKTGLERCGYINNQQIESVNYRR